MKKIISFILLLIGLYIISIFTFPSISSSIWEKLWLTWFNQKVITLRDEFNDFIINFDLMWKYKDTKNQALEIKQNVETQVNDTKQKIETIQTNVDKTAKAIDDTTKAIDNVSKTASELTKSIGDIVPKTSTWN